MSTYESKWLENFKVEASNNLPMYEEVWTKHRIAVLPSGYQNPINVRAQLHVAR